MSELIIPDLSEEELTKLSELDQEFYCFMKSREPGVNGGTA